MFSDHLKKVDNAPQKTLFIVAACLVLACQLVAMVMVVDGQVRKAALRDAHDASERVAIAQCMQGRMGFVRQSCIEQAQARSSNERLAILEAPTVVANDAARFSDGARSPSAMSSGAPGLISASFVAR